MYTEHSHVVHLNIPFGQLGSVTEWLNEHCRNSWMMDTTASIIEHPMCSYYFVFNNKDDALLFTLRYS